MPSEMRQLRRRIGQKPVRRAQYKVFISHAALDSWIAQRVCEFIIKMGGVPWLDIDRLNGGAPVYDAIITAITESDEVVAIISPNSVKSQWVVFEMGACCGQGKRVTPIRVCTDASEVPVVTGIRSIDLNDIDDFFGELKKRILSRTKQGQQSPHR